MSEGKPCQDVVVICVHLLLDILTIFTTFFSKEHMF